MKEEELDHQLMEIDSDEDTGIIGNVDQLNKSGWLQPL